MKSNISLLLVGALLLVAGTQALIFNRPCRSVPMVMDFDIEAYAGHWYEVQRYLTSDLAEAECGTFDYSYEENPSVSVVDQLKAVNRNSFLNNATHSIRTGVLTQRDGHHPSNVGHLMLVYDDAPHSPINYCLVASDYENYAVIWSCENLSGGRSNEDAWVLSQQQTLKPDFKALVQAAIENANLDGATMRDTYQGPYCRHIGRN